MWQIDGLCAPTFYALLPPIPFFCFILLYSYMDFLQCSRGKPEYVQEVIEDAYFHQFHQNGNKYYMYIVAQVHYISASL